MEVILMTNEDSNQPEQKMSRKELVKKMEDEVMESFKKSNFNLANMYYQVPEPTIELIPQLDWQKIDCDIIQGYYVSKPLPINEFIDFAKNHKGEVKK